MKTINWKIPLIAGMVLSASALGCEDRSKKDLAPTASALAPAKPESEKAAKMEVEESSSQVTFKMDAPLEIIHGRAPGSMSGDFFLDLEDITKSSGLLKVDLLKLEIHQQSRDKEDGVFGEEEKIDKQTEHARAWLEISDDAPKDKREEYRFIEFKISKVETSGPKSLAELSGNERTINVNVTGDFRLHGRVTTKTAEMQVTVKYEGGRPVSAKIKTTKPFAVGLDEHDVRPREGFGKLAQKTLEVLAPKVAKEAMVSLDFTAKAATN